MPLKAGVRERPLAVNILTLNHCAGSPSLGMAYQPYDLAREWVRSALPARWHRLAVPRASDPPTAAPQTTEAA